MSGRVMGKANIRKLYCSLSSGISEHLLAGLKQTPVLGLIFAALARECSESNSGSWIRVTPSHLV
jgi:hypothetical protein